MLPIVAATDRQAFEWGIRASHEPRRPKRIARITDTLHLSEMYLSPAALDERKRNVELIGDPMDLFDEQGALLPF